MKKVLLIGSGSYIGKAFQAYVGKERMDVTSVGAKDGQWRRTDFSPFDVVLHCAGLAHLPQKKTMKDAYDRINCQLAVEVAQKAKAAGVGQFIFLSSMSVYGAVANECITKETIPHATDFYGGSKLAAEKALAALGLNLCIMRPPMVYGSGCGGNFPRFVRLVERLPIFPNINNRRSMIYIDNLSECIAQAIEGHTTGVILPQNVDYVNTTALAQAIAKAKGKNLRVTKAFNLIVFMWKNDVPALGKLFGDLVYQQERSNDYARVGFEESIKRSMVNAEKLNSYGSARTQPTEPHNLEEEQNP